MTDWSEQESALFLDRARYYVPHRERQVALVAALVPRLAYATEVIDLCCGEGLLGEAVLRAQDDATVLLLERSQVMRESATQRLAPFGARVQTASCELEALVLPAGRPRRAIVSSLALHHVVHEAKPAFYRQLHDALAPGGVLVNADLVLPAGGASWDDAAESWDAAVRAADAAVGAGGSIWRQFLDDRWNWFRYPDHDVDHPARLAAELDWLRSAGFHDVDAHWLDCGHAIWSGARGA